MEIHRDSSIFNENGNPSFGLSVVKSKPEVAGTAAQFARTPLVDVKNKHSRGTPGMKPSRKFSIDSSCSSQDILSQLVTEPPKRQERNTKSRKSCFAMFNVPEDISAFDNRAAAVTLPLAIEEEPEKFTLQNQKLLGDTSELSGAHRTNMRSLKSKSAASLYEVLQSPDSDRAVGATLPQTVEEEPEMPTQQSQMLSSVYEVSGPNRTGMGSLKSKSVASLYEILKAKDSDVRTDRAVGVTLPLAIEEEPEMPAQQSRALSGVYELSGAPRTSLGGIKSKSVASLYEILKAKDSDVRTDRAVGVTLPLAIEEEPEMPAQQSRALSGVYELSGAPRTSLRGIKSKSVASLYEILKAKDSDVRTDRAVGVTIPLAIEEEPEMPAQQSQILLGVCELSGSPRTSMGKLRSRSVASLYERLACKDVNPHENIAAAVALPYAMEEEPEMATLLSQMLSHVSERTETTSSMRNLKTQTNRIQHETIAKSLLSLCELDVGNELTVLHDGTEIRNKDHMDYDCNLNSSSRQDCGTSDSHAEDAAPSEVGVSCEMKAVTPNTTASVCLPITSQFETETDNLEAVLMEGGPADFHQNSDASASAHENTISNLSLDHQYSKASLTSRNSPLQSQLTEQSLLAPALPHTSHSPHDVGSLQEQHSSTPKSTGDVSFQGFVTPRLSSSFEFMSISNSSFQEELQKTDLEDLIQSYLYQNPIPRLDLSPVAEVHDKNQSNCRASSPDQSLSDVLQSPVVYSCRHQSIDMTEVHLCNGKEYNVGTGEEHELEPGRRDSSVNFLNNTSVLFMANKAVENDFMSAYNVATSFLAQDSADTNLPGGEIRRRDPSNQMKKLDVNQDAYGADLSYNPQGFILNQNNHETDILDELQDPEVDEANYIDRLKHGSEDNYNSDLPDVLQDSEVNELNHMDFPNELQNVNQRFARMDCVETYHNNVFSESCVIINEETAVNDHMEIIAEMGLIDNMGVCALEAGDQLSQEGFYGSLADHLQVVESSSGQSLCEGMHEPSLLDENQFCAGTNAFDIVQADFSVLTDQQNLVNTSMVTDGCLVRNVSVLTDQQNFVNTSMLTDGCLVSHASVLTDQQNLVDTSMETERCSVRDVSIMANVCQGIDVSMVTDAWHGLDVPLVRDRVDMLEHSVMVSPECQTQETMTEGQTMVDAASSMTPLKLNKQGKRLTAEEVRRQHPRIVANQLDTLLASNQRLQKEVDLAVHNRDSLKSVLAEAKSKLATADKHLHEEKDRQGGVISIIEQYHQKTVAGLESSVKNKEDMIGNLQSELRDLKLKSKDTHMKWNSVSVELQEKCAQLEEFKSEADNHIVEETKKLQSQFEQNNYYHAFLASQQVIQEMQAEQEEFATLLDDIEHSSLLQSRLQELMPPLISKSRKVVKDHGSVCERLTKEKQAVQKQVTSLQTDLEVALSENKDLLEDIQHTNDILKRSQDNYTELESTYQAAKQDISKSQAHVTELNSKIEFGFKIVKDLMKAKADLTDQLSECQESNSLQDEKLKYAEQDVQNLKQQLERERQLMIAKSDYYEEVIAEHEHSKTSLELCIENLRGTLDSWEVDRDVQAQEISDCQEQLAKQRAKMEEMNKELQSLRKIKAVTQPERDYYQELRNTVKFLEAEKQLYLEALTDCRSRLESEVELAASNDKLIDALRSNNSELQLSNDQLMSDVQMLEETLSLKSTDLDASCAALDNLQERMESVLSSLQQSLGLEVKPDNSVREAFFTPNKPSRSFFEESSLATQALSAAKGRPPMPHSSTASFAQQRLSVLQSISGNKTFSSSVKTDEARLKQNNVQYGALQPRLGAEAESYLSPGNQSVNRTSQKSRMLTDSKSALVFSSTSKVTLNNQDVSQSSQRSHTSARKDLSRLYPVTEQNLSTPGYAKICSIPSTVDRTLESMVRAKGENSKSTSMVYSSLEDTPPCLDSDSMLAKVQLVDRLFSLILKAADMAQRTSDLTVKDLREDITLLEDKLKFQRHQYKDLETDLVQKSAQLAAVKSQLQEQNARMREKTQSLMALQDQQLLVTALEEDKAELNRKVRALREEVKLLTEQLNEVLKKFADVKVGQKSDGASVREIVDLKQKNHELVMKLFDERDKNKDVGDKAMRRLKILDNNWKKAEAEVKKFDDLVEQIRETCVGSQAQSTHPVILQVVRLIDGVQ